MSSVTVLGIFVSAFLCDLVLGSVTDYSATILWVSIVSTCVSCGLNI